ncbi:LITAF-like zinc ribbon domain-containing protein [Piptocephalis cylindrospora]|uniref:LITAF-like zinc ribbon domain-containing protein n=1 Tax=Piptocephalis cylindrospora TaxID=1907219 RepID=A0A4P9Y3F1_9FUNG|nr:LITAF-like zinc ribbon domain-containing protein [Piptocephalis cylindrospora]|eukprot:RKP13437.1 LITAF-like zinc ribbon domain-containing protein [Piptocephalis cylindrospora]
MTQGKKSSHRPSSPPATSEEREAHSTSSEPVPANPSSGQAAASSSSALTQDPYTAPAIPPQQAQERGEAPPPKYSPTDPIYRHDNLQGYYMIREGTPLQRRPEPYQVIVVPDRSPTRVYCPYCNTTTTTRVSRRPGLAAGCWAAICCFICWPCFWLPLVADPCLDEVHYCSQCNRAIAIYES